MNPLRRFFLPFRRSATLRVGGLAFGLALLLGAGLGVALGSAAPRQELRLAQEEIDGGLGIANALGWGLDERRSALNLLSKMPSIRRRTKARTVAIAGLREIYPEFESVALEPIASLGERRVEIPDSGKLSFSYSIGEGYRLIGRLRKDWPFLIHDSRSRLGVNGRLSTAFVGPDGPRAKGGAAPPAWESLAGLKRGQHIMLLWGDGRSYLTSVRRLPRRQVGSADYAVVSGIPKAEIDAKVQSARRVALAFGLALGALAGLGAVVGIVRSTRRLRALNQSLESHVAVRTAELAAAERSFRSLFENAPFGLYQCDLEGRFVRVNPMLASTLGFEGPKAMIESLGSLQALGDRPVRVRMLERLREDGEASGTTFVVGEHGRPMWLQETARIVQGEDRPLIEGAMHDVTEQRDLEDRLRQIGATDPLTGLLNRRGLEEAMESVETPVSFVTLDLDGFKRYNDTHGHPAGDFALRSVAEAIRRTVRSGDIVARAGGEEFVIVLSRTPGEGARRVAESLREAVAACVGLEQRLTVSGGVATALTLDDLDDAFAAADRALYRAKEGGRNQIVANAAKLV